MGYAIGECVHGKGRCLGDGVEGLMWVVVSRGGGN